MAETGLGPERFVLAGFSQGAATSVVTLLLQDAEAALTWREVGGGHHVSPCLLAALRAWLAAFERGDVPADPSGRAIPRPVPTVELPERPLHPAPLDFAPDRDRAQSG